MVKLFAIFHSDLFAVVVVASLLEMGMVAANYSWLLVVVANFAEVQTDLFRVEAKGSSSDYFVVDDDVAAAIGLMVMMYCYYYRFDLMQVTK